MAAKCVGIPPTHTDDRVISQSEYRMIAVKGRPMPGRIDEELILAVRDLGAIDRKCLTADKSAWTFVPRAIVGAEDKLAGRDLDQRIGGDRIASGNRFGHR